MEIQIKKGKKTALLFGATGLVGGFVLKQLLSSEVYNKIISFGRRKLKIEDEKLVHHVVDFDEINNWTHLIKGDDLFWCMGTTMKKAGSKKAFRKIDFLYPRNVAKVAHENRVNQFLLISSVGADVNSLFFYSEVKGELEDAIRLIPFWATHIFQPSILLGDRDEFRLGESIAISLSRLAEGILGDALSKYQPAEAEDVAKAMMVIAQRLESGVHVYPSHFIKKIAGGEFGLLKEGGSDDE